MNNNILPLVMLIIPVVTLSGVLKLITIISFLISGWSVYRKEKILVEDRFHGSWKMYFKDAFKTRVKIKDKKNGK